MTYVYCQESNGNIDFRVSRYEWLWPGTFIILGLLGLFVGFYGILYGFVGKDSRSFYYLFSAGGGITFSIGLLGFRVIDRLPKFLRFDNNRAQLIVSENRNFFETVSIPFQDLKEFQYRRKVDTTGSGSGLQPRYEVILIANDFQVWILGEFSSEAKAVDYVRFLATKIILSKEGQIRTPDTPESIMFEKSGRSIIFKWKNRNDISALLFLIILCLIYFIGELLFDRGSISAWGYYICLTLNSSAFVALFFFYLKKRNRTAHLEVSNKELIFSSEDWSGVKPIRALDLNKVRGIGPNFGGQDIGLLVYDEAYFQLMEEVHNKQFSLMDIFMIYRRLGKAFQIDVSGLSGIDIIRLMLLLRTTIRTFRESVPEKI